MVDSQAARVPTETTSLLAHNAETVGTEPALCDANNATGNGTLERGGAEPTQSNNDPLLERSPESRKKVYLLLPAVGLGVSISIFAMAFPALPHSDFQNANRRREGDRLSCAL